MLFKKFNQYKYEQLFDTYEEAVPLTLEDRLYMEEFYSDKEIVPDDVNVIKIMHNIPVDSFMMVNKITLYNKVPYRKFCHAMNKIASDNSIDLIIMVLRDSVVISKFASEVEN